ncbi:MAG: hypothetical protein ACT6RN_04890 [Agrobacterium sp.]|uniref:hypothetical protein n=1 Tax=Agrobacterium sp. TaxID=361 RepID=UPI004038125C
MKTTVGDKAFRAGRRSPAAPLRHTVPQLLDFRSPTRVAMQGGLMQFAAKQAVG